ncbi:MAG: AEC family transporter [Limnochordia bacterium]|jgi:predicted permease|nr:AEC family transporter [Bacillota bacterium]HOB09223.1 AEC family transporter [Limnochordia bacterium]NLH31305.1 AEC family transporter [Bacillota bacterium]HPT93660.1 AEC family transporter [Limnochordia bacterium]HPZ30066.1 AEC family transporter [Limnochordia bacterium]
MQVFFYILGNNIIPIFTVIFLGFLLNRAFKLDIFTLTKINLYVFVPIFVFVNLYTTPIDFTLIKALIFGIALLATNMAASSWVARIRGYDLRTTSAFKNAVMFYNSGNIGVPLITLVFSSAPYIVDGQAPYLDLALTIQVMILVVQNVTTNTIGVFNAGRAYLDWKESLKAILHMPTVYAIPTALILKSLPIDLTAAPFWPGFVFIRHGLISIALLTLGVQLSRTSFNFKDKDIYLAVAMRLIGGPALALILIKAFGFAGVVAQALMISSSVPTAVNTALIAVEFDNRPDYASQAVMLATILSAVTLTFVIYAARVLFPIG